MEQIQETNSLRNYHAGTQGPAQLGPAVPRHGVLDDLQPAAGRNEVRQRELLLRHGDVGARLQAEHLRGEVGTQS